MPTGRFFRPKIGFTGHPGRLAIRLSEDGATTAINRDGTESPLGSVVRQTRMPQYSLSELENLVKGGKWEEIEAPEPVKPAVAETVAAPTNPEASKVDQVAEAASDAPIALEDKPDQPE